MARAVSLTGLVASPFSPTVGNTALRPLAAAELAAALGADTSAKPEEATLSEIKVLGQQDQASTEHTGYYTTRQMATGTRMGLSMRETPQSFSVVTRQRMDDMGLNSLAEVLVQSTGVTVQENDSERTSSSARGFSIGNYQIDGVALNLRYQY